MKRKSVVVLTVGVVLGLCSAAVTIAQNRRVPVRGTVTGQLVPTQTAETPPTYSIKANGTAQLLGIGVGTVEILYEGIQLTPEGNNLVPSGVPGQGTLTLANGDKAFGTVRWLTSPTANPDVLAIVGTLTVTGGTGLFANVKGSGFAVGQGTVSTRRIRFSLDGFLEGLAGGVRRPGFGP